MRKSIGLLALLACAVILSACGQESVHEKQTSLTYSNLVDTGSRAQLAQLLADAGISEQSISGLMSNIIHFNQIAGSGNLISGFVTTGTLEPIYDQGKIQDLWAEKSPNFIGYNCRLTSFDLMKDLIKVQTPQSWDTSQLFMDEDAIKESPRALFNQTEKSDFFHVFAAIPTVLTKDVSVHLAKVQDYRRKNGISFVKKSDLQASLISVWMHSYFSGEENYLFIGHVGVLIPARDGQLYFIEKLAFQEPYQMIKFASRQDLSDYLMNKYDIEKNQPNARPFVMENDQLISGYRANPDNPDN